MKYKILYKVDELGEESGRDEATCDFPCFPDFSTFLFAENKAYSRMISHYGRARAQGLYRLRGKTAKVFALSFRIGYFATYDVFKREGHLEQEG